MSTTGLRGRWAQGLQPRYFTWVIMDRLGVGERPGGFARNHRKVRRQEELIWLSVHGFTHVVSLLDSPHNLHAYDEAGIAYVHVPLGPHDELGMRLEAVYGTLLKLLDDPQEKLFVHHEEFGDRLLGVMGGYLLYAGLVDRGTHAIAVVEKLTGRSIGSLGREIIAVTLDDQLHRSRLRPRRRHAHRVGAAGTLPLRGRHDRDEVAGFHEPRARRGGERVVDRRGARVRVGRRERAHAPHEAQAAERVGLAGDADDRHRGPERGDAARGGAAVGGAEDRGNAEVFRGLHRGVRDRPRDPIVVAGRGGTGRRRARCGRPPFGRLGDFCHRADRVDRIRGRPRSPPRASARWCRRSPRSRRRSPRRASVAVTASSTRASALR